MDFLKRERKFLVVVAATILVAALAQITVLSSTTSATDAELSDAVRSTAGAIREADRLREQVDNASGDGPADALAPLVRATERTEAARAGYRDTLLADIAYRLPPRFALPDEFQAPSAVAYDNFVAQAVSQETTRWASSSRYRFVYDPPITRPTLLQDVDADTYASEALSWAGLVDAPEQEDTGFGISIGRGEGDSLDAEAAGARVLEEARAHAAFQLLLISIVDTVVNAGVEAGVAEMTDLGFVARPRPLADRYAVVEIGPSAYRPITITCRVRGNEVDLMRFLEQAIAPNAHRSRLSLYDLDLEVDNALDPDPADDLVWMEVTLIAWLINPEVTFSLDREDSGDGGFAGGWGDSGWGR